VCLRCFMGVGFSILAISWEGFTIKLKNSCYAIVIYFVIFVERMVKGIPLDVK